MYSVNDYSESENIPVNTVYKRVNFVFISKWASMNPKDHQFA